MSHDLRRQLQSYFVLIRLPNVFTVPTNILVGYLSLTAISEANVIDIYLLMASSSLLYISGIVFNDYFDVSIDRKERPFRPLPSGRVPRRNALVLAAIAIIAANVLAFTVSIISLVISIALTATILIYDRWAKQGKLGPAIMGLARFLNIFLGASSALLLTTGVPWTTTFAAGVMFAYVYSISVLSRREVGEHNKDSYSKSTMLSSSIVIGVIVSIVALAFYLNTPEMSVNIILFSIVMYFTLKHVMFNRQAQSQNMQNSVRNMVLSIIILDSIFITAFAGLYYGVLSLAIIAPAIILAKKLYVT